MKRVSRLTALNTDEEQPGDDNARTPGNVAGDHVGTPTDNTRDVLQAIPLDAPLAPALPDYAARIKAWASSGRSQEAGRRTRRFAPVPYRRCRPGRFPQGAAAGTLAPRRCARGSSPTVRHGWHLQACRRPRGGRPTVVRVVRAHDGRQPGGIGSLQRLPGTGQGAAIGVARPPGCIVLCHQGRAIGCVGLHAIRTAQTLVIQMIEVYLPREPDAVVDAPMQRKPCQL